MRIVILGSSTYSETACAMANQLAECGYVPVGAIALSTLESRTLLRKLAQWGLRDMARYAGSKLIAHKSDRQWKVRNPYLRPLLKHAVSLRDVGALYGFPVAVCRDQNAPDSIERIRQWTPDLVVFTGGNILRKPLLEVPRLGVMNVHLGLLPEIRGMSSPEWSLIKRIPVGITIHFMNAGIDTGPVLQRYEFSNASCCESLSDLRNRLIAFGIEKMADVVAALDRGEMCPVPQSDLDKDEDKDNQYFVMHEWLEARAAEELTRRRVRTVSRTVHG